jgi:hypothetical protein
LSQLLPSIAMVARRGGGVCNWDMASNGYCRTLHAVLLTVLLGHCMNNVHVRIVRQRPVAISAPCMEKQGMQLA